MTTNRLALLAVAGTAFVAILVCVLLTLQFANVFRSWGWGPAGAYDKALGYWQSHDADRALHWCDVAIRRDPLWPPPYELRGDILQSRGELELAAQDYVRAGDAMHYDSLQYVAAGRLYEKLGDVERAASLYGRVTLADSRNARALEAIAKIRAGNDNPNALLELRDFMRDAAKRKPQDRQLERAWHVLRDAVARSALSSQEDEVREPPEEPVDEE